MTSTAIWLFVLFIFALICIAAPLICSRVFAEIFPTDAQEEARARRDVEEMLLKRANEEILKRPRVRAGTPL